MQKDAFVHVRTNTRDSQDFLLEQKEGEMSPLKNVFDDLINKIKRPDTAGNGCSMVLPMLECISTALEEGDLKTAQIACGQLNGYWLKSVAWCSELSKDIEKCLIAFEEYYSGR